MAAADSAVEVRLSRCLVVTEQLGAGCERRTDWPDWVNAYTRCGLKECSGQLSCNWTIAAWIDRLKIAINLASPLVASKSLTASTEGLCFPCYSDTLASAVVDAIHWPGCLARASSGSSSGREDQQAVGSGSLDYWDWPSQLQSGRVEIAR